MSFSQVNGKPKKKGSRSIDEEDDDFKPVDIDMTVVKNMLQSLESQQGLAGPASNIFGSMGISVPAPRAVAEDDLVNSNSQKKPVERKTSGPRPKPTDLPVAPPRHKRSTNQSRDTKPPPIVRQESNV